MTVVKVCNCLSELYFVRQGFMCHIQLVTFSLVYQLKRRGEGNIPENFLMLKFHFFYFIQIFYLFFRDDIILYIRGDIIRVCMFVCLCLHNVSSWFYREG